MGSILLILTRTSKNGRSKRRYNADAIADWFKNRSGRNRSEWNSVGLLVSATGRKMRWWGGSGMYLSWFVPNAVSTTPQCGRRFVLSKKRLSVHSLSQGRCGRRVWRRPTWRIRLGSLQFKRAGYPRSHLRQFVGKHIPSGVLILAAGIGLVPQRPLIVPPGGEQHPPVALTGGTFFFHFRQVDSHG